MRSFPALVLPLLVASMLAAQDPARSSPFEMVRFAGAQPEVQVNGTWWKPVRVGGVAVAALLAHAVKEHGKRWDKRFCEDLPLLLAEMGSAPGPTVELVLADPATGAQTTLPRVALSEEHRERIRDAEPRATAQPTAHVSRLERAHAKAGDARFAKLTQRAFDAERGKVIATADAAQDLDQLEWALEHEFAYLQRLRVDYRAALDTVRAALADGIDIRDFHIQLRKLVALFGDGHSRARGVEGVLARGCLPFAIADLAGKLAALPPGKNPTWKAEQPWLTAIDGVDIRRWLTAAEEFAPQGSPQLRRREALRFLPYVAHLRRALGQPARDDATVTIGGTEHTLRLADRPTHASLPLPPDGHRLLDGGLGYLRLSEMNSDAAQRVGTALRDLAKTRGLIIDVRDNGGGTREALRVLLPAILPAKAPPRVVNVAAFRLPPGTAPAPEGYLADRFLFPATATQWNPIEQQAIRKFASAFTPSWALPAEQFSPFHYMLAAADEDGPRYEQPIVVLMNEGCFSATDIFLSALEGLPRVTLLGTPSGGGSGRARQLVLSHSRLEVMLSSMASFQPNGALLEGQGVVPTILHPATLDDYLGRTDSALALARQR